MIDFTFAGDEPISQELSLHPVHLTRDNKDELHPSALVPFCSYQRNSNLLGQQRPEIDNMTICDKFEPTILEGQLCYSLDIARPVKNPTKSGKANGLFLLVDPNPFQLKSTENDFWGSSDIAEQTVKVFIHTLAPHTAFGPRSYGMSALKEMTGTKSFEQLPDYKKKCTVHSREECQTQKYLTQVEKECKCTPWTLETYPRKNQVKPTL